MNLSIQDILNLDVTEFINNFGYYSKKINREDIPCFIEYSLGLDNHYIFDKIINELDFYIRKCRKHNLDILISILFNYHLFKNILLENFDSWKKHIVPTNVSLILSTIMKDKNNHELIINNIGLFLENINRIELENDILGQLKQIPEAQRIIQNLVNERNNLHEYAFLSKLNIGTFYNVLNYSLLDEIKSYFNLFSNGNLDKIIFLANGSTSSVFLIKVGNGYVIKIGKERFTFHSQFSKYLLQPYVRTEYKDSNDQTICTLEIQDYCLKADISDYELEAIVEKLKTDGCIWLDKDKSNIGKLLQKNNRKISHQLDGFDYEDAISKEPIGNIGDLVIIDNDLILSPKKCLKRHSVYNVVSNKANICIVVDCKLYNNLGQVFNNILNQTFIDYEVICVNGDEESKKIIDEYLRLDNRFKDNIEYSKSTNIIRYEQYDFSNPYVLSKITGTETLSIPPLNDNTSILPKDNIKQKVLKRVKI